MRKQLIINISSGQIYEINCCGNLKLTGGISILKKQIQYFIHLKTLLYMGKGDRKSKRGKIALGSYGRKRPKKKTPYVDKKVESKS